MLNPVGTPAAGFGDRCATSWNGPRKVPGRTSPPPERTETSAVPPTSSPRAVRPDVRSRGPPLRGRRLIEAGRRAEGEAELQKALAFYPRGRRDPLHPAGRGATCRFCLAWLVDEDGHAVADHLRVGQPQGSCRSSRRRRACRSEHDREDHQPAARRRGRSRWASARARRCRGRRCRRPAVLQLRDLPAASPVEHGRVVPLGVGRGSTR